MLAAITNSFVAATAQQSPIGKAEAGVGADRLRGQMKYISGDEFEPARKQSEGRQ